MEIVIGMVVFALIYGLGYHQGTTDTMKEIKRSGEFK